MKLVKVYDVAGLVEREAKKHKITAYTFDASLVFIVGDKGAVLVVNCEGIHYKFDNVEEDYRIDCCPDEKGKIFICPTCACDVPIKEIMENAETQEVELGTFVRSFGARLESNYAVLLDSIKEIGLDPADYPRNKRRAV